MAEGSELRELYANTHKGFSGKPEKTCLKKKKSLSAVSTETRQFLFFSAYVGFFFFFLLRKQEMGRSPLAQAESDSSQSFQQSV